MQPIRVTRQAPREGTGAAPLAAQPPAGRTRVVAAGVRAATTTTTITHDVTDGDATATVDADGDFAALAERAAAHRRRLAALAAGPAHARNAQAAFSGDFVGFGAARTAPPPAPPRPAAPQNAEFLGFGDDDAGDDRPPSRVRPQGCRTERSGGGGGGGSRAKRPPTAGVAEHRALRKRIRDPLWDADSDDSDDSDGECENRGCEERSSDGEERSEESGGSEASEGSERSDGAVSPSDDEEQEEEEDEDEERADADSAAAAAPKPAKASVPAEGRSSRFRSAVFERYHRHGCALHTLAVLSGPLSVRGPCAVVGVVGEVLADGWCLRQRPVILRSALDVVGLVPTTRLARAPAPEAPPAATAGNGGKKGKARSAGAAAAARVQEPARQRRPGDPCDPAVLAEAASMFGAVDWAWAQRRLAAVRARLGTVPAAVLVLVHPESDARATAEAGGGGGSADGAAVVSPGGNAAAVRPPRFVARFPAPYIDAALLPSVFPAVVRDPNACAAAVGAANVGKSTLLRFLSNGLVSMHGECYWLELDLGQPQFGPPGALSIYRVFGFQLGRRGDGGDAWAATGVAECVASYYVGAPKYRCPVAMSHALAAVCRDATRLLGRDNNNNNNDNIDKRGALPMLINTHGWVLSTGRRGTLEALRRVSPSHAIHFLTDADRGVSWLTTETLHNVRCGLNSHTFARRFAVPGAPAFAPPEAVPTRGTAGASRSAGADAARPLHAHAVRVPWARQEGRKNAAALREHRWNAYFSDGRHREVAGPHADAADNDADATDGNTDHNTNAKTASNKLRTFEVALGALRFVAAEPPLPASLAALHASLAYCVVALCCLQPTDENDDAADAVPWQPLAAANTNAGADSSVAPLFVVSLDSVARPPRCVGFGYLASSDTEAAQRRVLRVVTPVAPDVLERVDCIVYSLSDKRASGWRSSSTASS